MTLVTTAMMVTAKMTRASHCIVSMRSPCALLQALPVPTGAGLNAMCQSRHGDPPKTLPFGKGLACKSPLADRAGESAELPEMTTVSQRPGCRAALATPL
jgi:hypothetical protein